MTWRTHIAIGANAIWIAGLTGSLNQSILVYLGTAAIAGILPDIDASGAKIHYIGGGALGIAKGAFRGKYFHHRGIMHSLFMTIFLSLILELIFKNSYPLLALIFAVSYFSHPLIDGFNAKVGYLYPFTTTRFALLPKALRARVGSPIDILLMMAGVFGLVIFFAVFAAQLINPATCVGPACF